MQSVARPADHAGLSSCAECFVSRKLFISSPFPSSLNLYAPIFFFSSCSRTIQTSKFQPSATFAWTQAIQFPFGDQDGVKSRVPAVIVITSSSLTSALRTWICSHESSRTAAMANRVPSGDHVGDISALAWSVILSDIRPVRVHDKYIFILSYFAVRLKKDSCNLWRLLRSPIPCDHKHTRQGDAEKKIMPNDFSHLLHCDEPHFISSHIEFRSAFNPSPSRHSWYQTIKP